MGVKWIDIMQALAVKAPLDSGPVSRTGQAFRRNDGVMQGFPQGEGTLSPPLRLCKGLLRERGQDSRHIDDRSHSG